MNTSRFTAIVYAFGAVAGMSAVGLEAFAAHGLAHGTPDGDHAVAMFRQATQFQMDHALALILIAAIADRLSASPARCILRAAAGLMMAAIILFPGALYASAFSLPHFFAPWGGTAALIGWLLFAVGALLTLRTPPPPAGASATALRRAAE
ncbi:MAG: DUF423 domain-containing protein [Rhodospirillaceae bacterium]|nr:MAG: DUF423 domain-containing protein [Rhodospirillaceae bacterium]